MYFGRAVMSRTWTEELCDAAVERDPGPNYPIAEGISAAVFDNLMMNVGYSSFGTSGQAGRKIEMTNWATLFLPAAAMPAGFIGMDALLGTGGIFRTDISIETFIDGLSPYVLTLTVLANISNKRVGGRYLKGFLLFTSSVTSVTQFQSPPAIVCFVSR